jgi:hypothetical protein
MARTGFRSTPNGHLRCSDAEREQVASFLRDHAVEGRLTADELADRVALAYRAVTIGELRVLVGDLPGSAAGLGHPQGPAARRRPAVAAVAGLGLLAVLLPSVVGIVAIAIALTLAVTVLALGLALGPFLLAGAAAVYALRRAGARGMLRAPRG